MLFQPEDTSAVYIVEKLESELTNKSKNVAVKTMVNKLKALLEIQKHI